MFVAYAGAGVGAIDVSNSDAIAGQDPTNPVTFAFGLNYAFHRTIVSMDEDGDLAYTPTINYGGNNGRSSAAGSKRAVLFGRQCQRQCGDVRTVGQRRTNPDVTETTGLEVVRPITALAKRDDPGGQLRRGRPAAAVQVHHHQGRQSRGKDDNYRGKITEYGGALLLHQRQRQQRCGYCVYG